MHSGSVEMLNVITIARALTDTAEEPVLIGGESAQERMVSSVGLISSTASAEQQFPNSLAIVLPEVATISEANLDVVLRRAANSRVSGVVVERGNGRIPLSTSRLSERLGIALWIYQDLDTETLRSKVDDLVRNPDLVGASTVRAVTLAMRQPTKSFTELVSRLEEHIGTPVALFGPDGTVIAGEQIMPESEIVKYTRRRDAAMADFSCEAPAGQQLLAVRALPLVADDPRFWLGAITTRSSDLSTSHIAVSLRIGALACSAYLNQAALTYERGQQGSRALLDEIRASGGRPGSLLVEQATASGWHLFGWHVAVQIRVDNSLANLPEPMIAYFLAEALHRQGFQMQPVVSGLLAEFWATWDAPPEEAELEQFATRIERALHAIELSLMGVRLKAGIGTPHDGPAGIAASGSDARSAIALAESEQGGPSVRRADQILAHRLIEHWVPESATREAVLESIQPLRAAEGGEQLILTLRTYLDLESNAAATAKELRLHRNTVLQRLQRIRELLPLAFEDPTTRLTIRLALRLMNA